MEQKYLDAVGVTHLWSKISMEDYPNNETLIAVLNAIDDTKADKVVHVPVYMKWGFPGGLVVKNSPANAGDARDVGSIPGSGRYPGGGHGNPL